MWKTLLVSCLENDLHMVGENHIEMLGGNIFMTPFVRIILKYQTVHLSLIQ
jgi:hypothetical protein